MSFKQVTYNIFLESIMDVWIKAEKKIDHNDIMKTLGNALSNVRDWEKNQID